MAITATLSGSVGEGVEFFHVYFDSPCFSGSDGGPVTGSTPGTASLYSGSQLIQVGGIEVDFPDDAQVAYIKTLGAFEDPVSQEISGSQYCSQCFGPVTIPGAVAPTPTPTPTIPPTPTPSAIPPTPTPTLTATPPPVSLATIRLYASWNGSQWVGLSSADAYCDANYSIRKVFKTDASSFATLSTGDRIYSGSGATTSFNALTYFAGGDSIFNTSGSSFEVIQVDTNGFVTSIESVDCTTTEEPGGGQIE